MDAPTEQHEDRADPTNVGLEIVPVQSQREIPADENDGRSLSLVPACTTSTKPKLSTVAVSQKGDDACSEFGEGPSPSQGSVGEVKNSIFEVTCQVNGCDTRILRQPNRFLFLRLRRTLLLVTCHLSLGILALYWYLDFLVCRWTLTQTQTYCTVVT